MSDLESETELLPRTKMAGPRKGRRFDWCCHLIIICFALLLAIILFWPLSFFELRFTYNATEIECTLLMTQIRSAHELTKTNDVYPLLYVQCDAVRVNEKHPPNIPLVAYRGLDTRATWSLADTTLWLATLPPVNSSISIFYNPTVDPILTASCEHTTQFKIGIAISILSIATIVGTLCIMIVEYVVYRRQQHANGH